MRKKNQQSRLRQLRDLAGVSQRKMASEIGIWYTGLQRIEKGTASPKISTARKIAAYLGVSIDEVFGK